MSENKLIDWADGMYFVWRRNFDSFHACVYLYVDQVVTNDRIVFYSTMHISYFIFYLNFLSQSYIIPNSSKILHWHVTLFQGWCRQRL